MQTYSFTEYLRVLGVAKSPECKIEITGETISTPMILRNNICGTLVYPWSIRTFLAFAAADGILLDLVILGWSRDGSGEVDVSRFQTSVVESRSRTTDTSRCGR